MDFALIFPPLLWAESIVAALIWIACTWAASAMRAVALASKMPAGHPFAGANRSTLGNRLGTIRFQRRARISQWHSSACLGNGRGDWSHDRLVVCSKEGSHISHIEGRPMVTSRSCSCRWLFQPATPRHISEFTTWLSTEANQSIGSTDSRLLTGCVIAGGMRLFSPSCYFCGQYRSPFTGDTVPATATNPY